MSKMIAEYKAEQRKIRARQDEIKSRPKIYVASRYAGDIAENVEAAKKYCRYVVSQRRIPVASHLIYPRFLDDGDKMERELGTMFGLALLAICDEVWVFGRKHSIGMQAEIVEAKRLQKPIRFFDEYMEEIK